ncbi:hypothetical protein GCM10027059_26040 [Myceligenerans halotolerans]
MTAADTTPSPPLRVQLLALIPAGYEEDGHFGVTAAEVRDLVREADRLHAANADLLEYLRAASHRLELVRAQASRVQDLFRWLECHEAVVPDLGDVDGEEQPCNGIAVAWRIEPDVQETYPVCIEHIREPMASLAQLRAALDGGTEADRG